MPFVCPVCKIYVTDRKYNLSRHAINCSTKSTNPPQNLQAAIDDAINNPEATVVQKPSQRKRRGTKASSSSKPPPTTKRSGRYKMRRTLPSVSELVANIPPCIEIPGILDCGIISQNRPRATRQAQPENSPQPSAQPPNQEHSEMRPGTTQQPQSEERPQTHQQGYSENRPQTPNQAHLKRSEPPASSALPRSPTPSKSSKSLTLYASSSSPVSPVSTATSEDMESRSPTRNHSGNHSTPRQMLFNRTPFKARKKELKRSSRRQDSHITLTRSPSFFPATEVDSQIQDLQFGYRLLRYELYEITKINSRNQETIAKLCDTIQQLTKK